MKKHALAVAIATAFSMPAVAQVTITGIVDVGMGKIDTGATSSASRFSGTSGGLSTSEIRFSGSEDLGGGLRAGFTITQEFAPATGAISGAANNNPTGDATTLVRDSFQNTFVSLSGGFGTVQVGRLNHGAREAGGAGRVHGNFGRVDGTIFRNLGVDTDHSVNYTSPSISGFTFGASFGGKQSGADVTAASVSEVANTRTQGVVARYSSGPMTVGLSRLERDETNTTTTRKTDYLGVTYNAGVATFGVVHTTNDANKNAAASTSALEYAATAVSVAYPMGKTSLHANYTEYDAKSVTNYDATGISLGISNALSKRTTLYALYSKTTNQSSATVNHGGSATTTPSAGLDPSIFNIGVRHSF